MLPAGSAGSVLPAPCGKRHFPCLTYDRSRREVESRPLHDLPVGHLPLVTVSLLKSRPRPPPHCQQLHGLGATLRPMAAQFPPMEGLVLRGASLGKPPRAHPQPIPLWGLSSPGMLCRGGPSENVPQAHARSSQHHVTSGPSAQACLMLGSCPWPLPWPGGNRLSPSPGMCLCRRKGCAAALSRSCFRPPARPTAGPSHGDGSGNSCS